MNFLKRSLCFIIAAVMVLGAIPLIHFTGGVTPFSASAADTELEYALFPMTVLNIVRTNTKIDADQLDIAAPDGGHVHYAWDLSGSDTSLVAPFTAKVIFADKSGGHSVIIESVNKVKLANGSESYVVAMFTHDDALNSNIKVGNTIKRGEHFYDQGTFGDGKKGTYDRHVHIEIAVGQTTKNDRSSFGNLLKFLRSSKGRQLADVFHLAYGTQHKKDYVKVVCQNNKIIKFNWKTQTMVNFNTNGGSAIASVVRIQGDTFDLSKYVPTKDGYNFEGWYSDEALTKKVTSFKLAEIVTVHAKWVEADPCAKGHTEVIDPKVEPTCTSAGVSEGKHCSVCNKVITAQLSIPALGNGHTYTNSVDKDCNVCGYTRTVTYTGWLLNGGKWYYYESGRIVVNTWRRDSKGWVYLGADGAMLTNSWCKDSKGWCYVGADGYAVTNCWKRDSIGWIWLDGNGSMTKNTWIKTDGKWYYLNANGYMASNTWCKDSKGWVYLGADGAMLTNSWCKDSKGWCYVGADGYAVTNCWMKDSIGWIWLDGDGSMAKDMWIRYEGAWYYVNAYGYLV